jgi:capsule polysaccharide export protein KpsE/RkpR
MYWCVRKAHESAAEYSATGMLRSPLYWTAMILVCVLFGLAFSERYVLTQSSTLIWIWWAALAATVIALLIVRRALKWRYPI